MVRFEYATQQNIWLLLFLDINIFNIGVNNYMVSSYIDFIAVINTATKRTN